ncbi:hypothetical protein L1987_63568 [Smallanthus sonchifolius]|uniref:Uncharacterized protein n=1 Tax=Smallanthus sonchifolius TaxID=185202 RepID=A0ACB9CDM7_9ASTR|nr:hypothetical protein L1987_63568 [Smallanthus sonchifolius]
MIHQEVTLRWKNFKYRVWIWEEPGDWIPDSLDEDPVPWLTDPGIDDPVSASPKPGNEESLGTEEVSDLKSVANHDVPFTGMGNRNFKKKVIRRNSYKLGKAHPKKAASPAEERPKKRLRSTLEDDLFGLDKILGLGQ